MTLGKMIERVRSLFETRYDDAILADWAAEMDGRILQEDYLRKEFEIAYDPTNDENTMLLMQAPWERLYDMWLLQKIHFYRGEYEDAANFEAAWNRLHTDWLRNTLATVPQDPFGRPWLTDLAFVRRGSNGVVHMHMLFGEDEIAEAKVTIVQDDAAKVSYPTGSESIFIHDHWLTLYMNAEETVQLHAGGAIAVTEIETVNAEHYESDSVQLRVLPSALEGVR